MRTRKEIEGDLKKLDIEYFRLKLKGGLMNEDCDNDSEEMDFYCKKTDLNMELSKLDWFGNE